MCEELLTAAIQIQTANILSDFTEMERVAQRTHDEVLELITAFTDPTSSDGASFVCPTCFPVVFELMMLL